MNHERETKTGNEMQEEHADIWAEMREEHTAIRTDLNDMNKRLGRVEGEVRALTQERE